MFFSLLFPCLSKFECTVPHHVHCNVNSCCMSMDYVVYVNCNESVWLQCMYWWSTVWCWRHLHYRNIINFQYMDNLILTLVGENALAVNVVRDINRRIRDTVQFCCQHHNEDCLNSQLASFYDLVDINSLSWCWHSLMTWFTHIFYVDVAKQSTFLLSLYNKSNFVVDSCLPSPFYLYNTDLTSCWPFWFRHFLFI